MQWVVEYRSEKEEVTRRLEENALLRESSFMLFAKCYSGDEIHEHEVGGECSRDGGRGEIHAVCGGGT